MKLYALPGHRRIIRSKKGTIFLQGERRGMSVRIVPKNRKHKPIQFKLSHAAAGALPTMIRSLYSSVKP